MSEEITRSDIGQAITDITKQSSYTWLPIEFGMDELRWQKEWNDFAKLMQKGLGVSAKDLGTIQDTNCRKPEQGA